MPLVFLLLSFAPLSLAITGMQQEYQKEEKVIEICTEKFKTVEEIQQCKAVLIKLDR